MRLTPSVGPARADGKPEEMSIAKFIRARLDPREWWQKREGFDDKAADMEPHGNSAADDMEPHGDSITTAATAAREARGRKRCDGDDS